MAKAKKPNSTNDHSFLERVSDQVGHLKDVIVEGKDHVLDATGGALESIKGKIHEYRVDLDKKTAAKRKKVIRKKAAVKKSSKKLVRTPAKKVVKKAAKKVARKVVKNLTKKAPAKSGKKKAGKRS
jgi:hypothetical protein